MCERAKLEVINKSIRDQTVHLAAASRSFVSEKFEAARLAMLLYLRARPDLVAAVMRKSSPRCQRIWTLVELARLKVFCHVTRLDALATVEGVCAGMVGARAARHRERACRERR